MVAVFLGFLSFCMRCMQIACPFFNQKNELVAYILVELSLISPLQVILTMTNLLHWATVRWHQQFKDCVSFWLHNFLQKGRPKTQSPPTELDCFWRNAWYVIISLICVIFVMISTWQCRRLFETPSFGWVQKIFSHFTKLVPSFDVSNKIVRW